MKLAVGKGSLQRAASAAGKNTKAKSKTVKAAETKAQSEAAKVEEIKAQSEAAKVEEIKAQSEAAKVEEIKAQSEAAKVEEIKAQSEAVKAAEEVQDEAVEAAGTRGRAAKASAEKVTEAGKTQSENANAAAVKTRKKRSVKQQDSAYLLTISAEQLLEIPEVWQNGKQLRANVSALAESVSRCGILEPLPVVQTGEKQYQLVGGSKRMQVVQMLGIANVPVLVLPGSTKEEAQKLYQELKLEAGTVKKQNQTLSLFGKQRIPEYLL